MALLRRQAYALEYYDDRSRFLSFMGNWTRHRHEGAKHNTLSSTSTPGSRLSFTFSGSRVWLYGDLLKPKMDGECIPYPTVEYTVDGCPALSQKPVIDTTQNRLLYFWTPILADGTHKVDIRVITVNETNPFTIDYFLTVPVAGGGHSSPGPSYSMPSSTTSFEPSRSVPSSISGVMTPPSVPSPPSTPSRLPVTTMPSIPVGEIVGGIIGGFAGIVFLVLALLWCFLRKRSRGDQAYYFEKPSPEYILADEGHIEPFDVTATTPPPLSAGFSGLGPQPTYPNSPSNLSFREVVTSPNLLQSVLPSPSQTVPTHISDNLVQPRVGKAASLVLQNQDVQQPTQYRDSGIRFDENGEKTASPSKSPDEVPPTYMSH